MSPTLLRTALTKLGELNIYIPTPATQGRVTNLDKFKHLVNESANFPGLKDLLEQASKLPIWDTTDDASFSPQIIDRIRDTASKLTSRLQLTKLLLDEMGVQKIEPDQVIVKLPSGDLVQISEDIALLRKSLEQVILNPKVNGKLNVVQIESGSVVLILSVGSSAVIVIGMLAWAAAVVFKKYQEARAFSEHVRSLEIHNEALKNIADAQNALLKKVIEAEARHLDKEIFGEEEDPERLERVKYSIASLQQLLSKGAEVHPALTAPENVKNLFPDLKHLMSVESKIKQIAEKSGN